MEKMNLKKWSILVLMMFTLTLTVGCGGNDEAENEIQQARVFPTYVFSEGVYWAEGYATPDFTHPRGSVVDGVKNYSFQYQVKLIDEKNISMSPLRKLRFLFYADNLHVFEEKVVPL